MLRNLCRFAALIGLTATIFLSAPPRANACPQTCSQECVTFYDYCFYNPGGNYEGCNFVRSCGGSANLCDLQECQE
jgi:hypothetical protein